MAGLEGNLCLSRHVVCTFCYLGNVSEEAVLEHSSSMHRNYIEMLQSRVSKTTSSAHPAIHGFSKKQNETRLFAHRIRNLLPEMGMLLIASCHARATCEVHWASPVSSLPCEKSGDKQVSSWRHISCHTDKNRYYT